MAYRIKFLIGLFIISSNAFSQSIISGRILDQETNSPIHNVNIHIAEESSGSISSVDGYFEISTEARELNLTFSSIGYKDYNLYFKNSASRIDLGTIFMQEQPYSLDEITINAGLNSELDLPITVSSISSRSIDKKLGDQPLPLILQSTPGVFSIRDGGGSGDSKLNIRGFNQENVSLLLNGIPINGEENGLVYWSNWLGLSAATAEIQIQKGPGLANAAVNAIGGTINIITRNANKEKGGSVSFELTDYGNFNTNIALNSGQLKNGWNTSLMLSFGSGSGYVDATYVKSWSYFFSAHKTFSENHNITISLLGAPQRHGQRTIKLSNKEVELKGLKFNKDWGGFNGQIENASENFYHKPFLSINDELKLSEKSTLSTSVYLSMGNGGGQWSESFNYAPSIFSYRDDAGQIDWYSIYDNNSNNEGTYTLDNGETVSGYSQNVQTNFLASHIQTGIMSNFEYKINDHLRLISGLHYRYFNSHVREVIDDLMGGDFFIEDYGWSLAGVAGRNQIKTVGDIIRVDNNTIINFLNVHSQLVYDKNKINAFLSANLNNNWYKRIDRFNYIENTESETVAKPGFDLRGGINYKPNGIHNLYINAAYISRAPFFKYVFGNFTNVIVQDLNNENVSTIEAGYRIKWRNLSANVNAYVTSRKNVSTLSNEYVQLEDNSQTRAMINGLNSIHKGLEMELTLNLRRNLNFGTWLSLGDFKWQNDVNATLFNDQNIVVDTINVYANGLFVGGTAQQQFGLFADFSILRTLNIKTEYMYFSKLFADFDPTTRDDANDLSQPFQLPSYGIVNIYIGIPFSIGKLYGNVQLNAYNVFDKTYIVNGEDGDEHNLETFRGFWSFGRNLSAGIKINF